MPLARSSWSPSYADRLANAQPGTRFARVHGVSLEKLLSDLDGAKDAPASAYREELADVHYRRFFRAAILVVLTAGASLGAAMLFLYGLRGSFTSRANT